LHHPNSPGKSCYNLFVDPPQPVRRAELNADILRDALRLWATGVTVVCAQANGLQHGMTVNSFTSITLQPPLILVSLSIDTRTHGLVQESGAFGVTILSQAQEAISERFAGRTEVEGDPPGDRFQGLETFTLASGAPFIEGGLAFFDCRVVATYPLGDHTLFIGQVEALEIRNNGAPLIYFDRTYHHLPPEP
jgi:flavin reductase (DIM6/NTAB) family NADH-FMN oxidoreductase RutF